MRSLALGAAEKEAGTVRCDLQGLAEELSVHPSLTSLDLAALRIDDPIFVAIAAALPQNSTLLSLVLVSTIKSPQAIAAEASIRVILDRNRAIAAEEPTEWSDELLATAPPAA
eukprot:CAMPEP_0195643600 /NCGR_PEP_ID=MMETSP0815-20121206/27922_1 /TAXON_ID=97485 /ORGANISM="Prymnesium parvum, Strain Texoma1" /LENGTH=112 /DNA_ID=CAMNT_0040786653 /DNA_START=1 /DNA_END=336 /DNA_ORIENTATION=+